MDLEAIGNEFADQYLIYNRKSTDDAINQQNSLAYQRKRNTEFVVTEKLPLAKDLTIRGFCTGGISDEAHSAFKEEDEFVLLPDGTTQYRILRPKFAILIRLLKEKKIRGVIFLCWHRASRNEHDDMIIKKLGRLGADIRFTDTRYDKGSSGDFHKDADGMFARHYSRVVSDGVRKANTKLRDEGRCIYPAPIGYLDNGSISKPLDQERAPTVKRIFELYGSDEWSIRELAKWAQQQGLTKKPRRRMRTKEELGDNVELESISQVSRPVDHKTIEYILRNRFYIGEFKLEGDGSRYGGKWRKSNSHQPLVDTGLFNKVQQILSQKNKSVHYVVKPFFTYRSIVRCSCGRAYTPYVKKGITYYTAKCHPACENMIQTLTDGEIGEEIQKALDSVHLTDTEIAETEVYAHRELATIAEERDKKLADFIKRQQNIMANIDYLTQERITLLRTGAMDGQSITQEQARLEGQLAAVQGDIRAYSESAKDMLRFVMTFSALAKEASIHYKLALDSEKRDLVMQVFSELTFVDGRLVNYRAKDGFDALLRRFGNFGEYLRICSNLF